VALTAVDRNATLWTPMSATRHVKIKKNRAAFGLEENPLLKEFDNTNFFIILVSILPA
jgi:hypothetical protein